jgi:hypothetical protein
MSLTIHVPDAISVAIEVHQAVLDGLADVPPTVRRRDERVFARQWAGAVRRAAQEGEAQVIVLNEEDGGEVARWTF